MANATVLKMLKQWVIPVAVLSGVAAFIAIQPASGASARDAELQRAVRAMGEQNGVVPPVQGTWRQSNRSTLEKTASVRAEHFVVGPEWEFDGFVAGGQDSTIKKMFVVNDLLYLNVGFDHGIETGDRLEVFKRGPRVRDPQTGRLLGYEIRKAGVSLVTDKVNDGQCTVRIIQSYEPVEVGDIVRRLD